VVNVQSSGYKKHKSTAGDYLALGTVSQSISPAMLQKLQNRMSEVKSILESSDQTAIAKLNREDVMGNMHYATMLGYYAQLLGQTRMIQQNSKVHEILTGFGTFGSEVGIADRFGLPVGIKAGGIGLDIPISKTIVADNNNKQAFLNYRQQAGMIASSLEHQTPEQMYNTDPANPVQGISTMKAFALANSEGQKIYTITSKNIYSILPKIQASSLTKGDITSAVNAGKTVTVHEREVSVPGWTGTGYMVTDPVNGDGAYMISGGGNGGFIKDVVIPVIFDIIKVYTIPFAVVSFVYSMINAYDKLLECAKNGSYFALAAFVMITIAFIAFMTYLTYMAVITGGLSLIYIVIFSTVMETMNANMSSALLETC
jgi:hypothetical protein